jgi:peptidoglycan-associated lipoprotein
MTMYVRSAGAVLCVVMAAACSKRTPAAEPAPPSVRTTSTSNPAEGSDSGPGAMRSDEVERSRAALTDRIHFAYDVSELTTESQTTLRAKLPALRADGALRLRIEGHADERGSTEYNLALGLRRARAAQEYLAAFGIDASRLAVETLGEDRPLDRGHDERAWSVNRRAEFVPAGASSR